MKSRLSGSAGCCGCDSGGGAGAPAGSTFIPSNVTGLELQLDPELGLTVDGSGNVATWADQSGHNHHAKQDPDPSVFGGLFTVDPDAFGVGLAGLVAATGGGSLVSAAAARVFAPGAARTVFVVAKVLHADNSCVFVSFQPGNIALATTFALGLWNFGNNGVIYPYTDGVTGSQSIGDAPATFENATKIYAYRFSGAGYVEVSVNGRAFQSLAGTAYISETGDNGYMLGRFTGTTPQGKFKGTLGPIYGYAGALSDDDAFRVVTALSERFAVSVGVRAVTAVAPLVSSGGATPAISFPTVGALATVSNLTGPITSVGAATTIADAELAALAGLTSAADTVPYFTGSGTAALASFTATGRAMAAAASAVAQAELLGSEIPTQGSNLTDANATLTIAGGAQYVLPASTLTANRVLTLGVTGSPLTGETIAILRRGTGAFTLTIQDDAATVLLVMPVSTRMAAYFRFNGTHFALASAVRIQ